MTLSDDVLIAIVLQVGTLLGLLITALGGRRKLDKVHDLVNGRSDAQEARIRELEADNAALAAKVRPSRPRRKPVPPSPDSAVTGAPGLPLTPGGDSATRVGPHTG